MRTETPQRPAMHVRACSGNIVLPVCYSCPEFRAVNEANPKNSKSFLSRDQHLTAASNTQCLIQLPKQSVESTSGLKITKTTQ